VAFASPGQIEFQLAYQISPITMTGGNLASLPGGALPILALTQPGLYGASIIAGAIDAPDSLDDYFPQFIPLPGCSLVDNQIGEYPFANQSVAANAIIVQPLRVAMLMIWPPTASIGYFTRGAILSNLQATLSAFNLSGGLYTVATPSFVYTNCIMTKMEDVSPGISADQPISGVEWRFDFEQPLVTLQQAAQAQNNLMGKLTSQTYLSPTATWSGTETTTGLPSSVASPAVVPTSQPTPSGFNQLQTGTGPTQIPSGSIGTLGGGGTG
jgi:hypothetical protein